MKKKIEHALALVRDLDAEIAVAMKRSDDAWRGIRIAVDAAHLRRGRKKAMERTTAEKQRTRKLCQKAGLLALAAIIDEDDEVLLGIFLKVGEDLEKSGRREAWRRRGATKLLRRAKGPLPILIIRFSKVPPDYVLAKLDEDGFDYDAQRMRWTGDGDRGYGEKLLELSGVGGNLMVEPARPAVELSP